MKQHLARVVDNRLLWGTNQLLTIHSPELARSMRPGQFALARDPCTLDPYLRRTLWLYETQAEKVALTLDANDPLAIRARTGDALDVLAPLGRAVEFERDVKHILLIGEGERIAPLVGIAHAAVRDGREVVLDCRSISNEGSGIFPHRLLSPEIEYRTSDVESAELIAWADALILSGSGALLRAVADALRATRYRIEPGFARALIEMPMPCGTGVCYACAVDTSRGAQLVCVDGPAIDLVELDRVRT